MHLSAWAPPTFEWVVMVAAPVKASERRTPQQHSSILLILVFLCVILPCKVAGCIIYDRETLLNIRDSGIIHCQPEFFYWDPQLANVNKCLTTALLPRRRRRRRGRRAGLLVRLRRREGKTPLPSILLANVQSIENKIGRAHV